MGAVADGFNTAFREFVVDGVPASGINPPEKIEAKALGALIEAAIAEDGPVVSLVGAAHTLTLDQAGAWLEVSHTSTSTLTVPANADVAFDVGTMIEGAQAGAGTVNIVGAAGVTVTPAANQDATTAAAGAVFGLKKIDTNVWRVFGNLSAA